MGSEQKLLLHDTGVVHSDQYFVLIEMG